jgi:hypothetical protein
MDKVEAHVKSTRSVLQRSLESWDFIRRTISFDLEDDLTAVESDKAGLWARSVQFRRAGALDMSQDS